MASSSAVRLRAAILLLLCFLAGAIAGVVGDRLTLVRQQRILPWGGARFVTSRIAAHLDHELQLSPTQKQQIFSVLEAHRRRVELIWSGVKPAVLKEISQADHDIEVLLDPKQRDRFRQLLVRWHRAHGFMR